MYLNALFDSQEENLSEPKKKREKERQKEKEKDGRRGGKNEETEKEKKVCTELKTKCQESSYTQ